MSSPFDDLDINLPEASVVAPTTTEVVEVGTPPTLAETGLDANMYDVTVGGGILILAGIACITLVHSVRKR